MRVNYVCCTFLRCLRSVYLYGITQALSCMFLQMTLHGSLCPCLRARHDGRRVSAAGQAGAPVQCRRVCFGRHKITQLQNVSQNESHDLPQNASKNVPPAQQKFMNNSVRYVAVSPVVALAPHSSTAKYNVFTFLPRFLMEQFRRYANIFFLTISVVQQIPSVSPTGRFTTLLPLCVILCVSALKELYVDFVSARTDTLAAGCSETSPSRPTRQPQDDECATRWTVDTSSVDACSRWRLCARREQRSISRRSSAALVQVSSMRARARPTHCSEPLGMAYIETSNLDGETNLKLRQGHMSTVHCVTSEQLTEFSGVIECDLPNK
jgi:hypothetical protein